MIQHLPYRVWSAFRHYLSAWNTGGEGIHSPYLFYLVRHLMYDTHSYYSWGDIEHRRMAMLRAPKLLHVDDYGTGKERQRERLVMDIARREIKPSKYPQLLFRWLRYMGESAKEGLQVVELGTSLGITTAYLAAAHSRNKVLTFEGSGEVLEMAQMNWDKLSLHNITAVQGNIDDTLEHTLYKYAHDAREGKDFAIDMAFLDANHTYEATLRYWDILLPYHKHSSIYVLDDIHHSPQMEEAWLRIQSYPQVTSTMDLYGMGIVFFDPQFMHRNYKLRY